MTWTLTAAVLDARRFTPGQMAALADAIELNDKVDAQTPLPGAIRLDHGADVLIDCFRLSRQYWQEGVRRAAMIALARKLAQDRDLSPEDRLAFKHVRARFKHLRFAFALYSARHAYPTVLDWMTTAMGHLQDAFTAGRGKAVAREAALLRLFLSAVPQTLLRREIDRLTPASGAGFRRYVEAQMAQIRATLARTTVTSAQFHATRKIVSRQVSFYDDMRTIDPSSVEAYAMSRALAAINGLMGAMHDDLVTHKVSGTRDYHRDRFPLPDEIRSRLSALVDLYPGSRG